MRVRRWVAAIALSVVVNASLHAQAAPVLRATPTSHPLRDAIARQHQPLGRTPLQTRASAGGRGNSSTATKVTAGFALGFAGFWVGAFSAFAIQNAVGTKGDGRTGFYTGGIIGAGAGAALGVWLASR